MANELIDYLNSSPPNGLALRAQRAILPPPLVFLEITPELPDLLGRFLILGLHPRQVQQHPVQIAIEQPGFGGLHPFPLLLSGHHRTGPGLPYAAARPGDSSPES